uniref:Uncharacterized protein n=2 Tax=Candidatus Kentrum sp. SD TaxID=2126332 RepID=A0A450YCE6_9GAMM|nr:MAG: hypothetical protein BECKSD772F_GA0070984_100250 [Candidatus Kentron sp. SD]VFK39220.1 MAG: hypothetical protein BECKSD772E_GA0070983_100248 [Candidatus Kentron sp. SD]
MGEIEPLAVMGRMCIRSFSDPIYLSYNPTIMLRVPITLENETTTPVGRVELRVTRQKCIKNVGLRRLRA